MVAQLVNVAAVAVISSSFPLFLSSTPAARSSLLSPSFVCETPSSSHHDPHDFKDTKIMARKHANGDQVAVAEDPLAASTSSTSSNTISGLLASAATSGDREEVKVNNASVTDMKHACDDALKRVSVLNFLR